MKKIYLLFLLFSATQLTQAQTWQWGKRGGGTDNISFADWSERVKIIKTDSQGNIYILSTVSTTGLDIDDHPKTGYNSGGNVDYAIASFACDGTYRWSKIIGGMNSDFMEGLEVDNQNNIYVVGRLATTSTLSPTVHLDDDLELPQSPFNVNTFKKGMFIMKFDTNGNRLWYKMPQPDDTSIAQNGQDQSMGLSTDSSGNSWWFVRLHDAAYADGAYTVSTPGNSYHVLKYDAQGNFIGGVPISITDISDIARQNLLFAVHHQTGTIYFTGYMVPSFGDTISFDGNAVTHEMYLAAYGSTGNFMWKKESTQDTPRADGFRAIKINDAGDIYLTGSTGNGTSFGSYTFNSSYTGGYPFILKVNASGEVIWGTNSNAAGAKNYSYAITEGAACGGFGRTQTWGSFTLSSPPGTGYDVYITRFNPATGEITGMETLMDDDGYADYGTAITNDANGNIYVGGRFEHWLYVNSPTPLVNNGSQTDFFIAKFGSDNCELGVEENVKTGLNAYPNPVRNILNIPSQKGAVYQLYNVLGQNVQHGIIDANAQINIEAHQSGIYILHIGTDVQQQTIKIVKE